MTLSFDMDILALETSSPTGSAALWRDGRIVRALEFRSQRAHNAVLFQPLRELLGLVENLGLIVTGTGPGSYTGVRVGIAAAAGISVARDVPMIGLPSILALEGTESLPRYAVCGDARRGAWWWLEIENGRLQAPPVSLSLEEATARAAGWTGPAFTMDPASPPFCQAVTVLPAAALLASAAGRLPVEEVKHLTTLPVEPLYLAAPYITTSKQPVFA